jgi:pSer/pThr/pTyr-binding forkhead associated (FHA) protein
MDDTCRVCGANGHALLCDGCDQGLARAITPEQVKAALAAPLAALLGPDGVVVPLGAHVTIGRDTSRCQVALLCASVSARHARIERTATGWTIADLGSTNGTFVDGRAIGTAAVEIAPGARVRMGAVELYLTTAPAAMPAARRRRRTTWPGTTTAPLEVIAQSEQAGGIVRLAGHSIALTARELRLVAILADRRRAVHDPELAYVPSLEIAAVLGFRSIDADSDNVRELVLRVRRKLRAAGAGDLIQTRRGAGYRLGDEAVADRVAA